MSYESLRRWWQARKLSRDFRLIVGHRQAQRLAWERGDDESAAQHEKAIRAIVKN